jgi:hypothetical protein
MNKNIKIFFFRISLLVISILLIFVICEVSIRLIGLFKNIDFRLYMVELKNSDRLPKELFREDGIFGLRSRVQVLATTSDFSVIYKTNSQGLRDKEYDFLKPRDKIRMLAFGDSFTFGEGIKYGDRFTDIPENYFHNLEIINFGIPGAGLDDILLYFIREGLQYSPDYLVLFLHEAMSNRYSKDIIKNNSIIIEGVSKNKPIGSASTLYLNRENIFFKYNPNFILRNSYFLSFLNYRITLFKLHKKLEQYDKKLWQSICGNCGRDNIFRDHSTDPYIGRTLLIIRKLNEICKQNGIRLIIIKISIGTNFDYLKNIDSNISFFDLTDGLKEESRKYSLYFKYDGHYNKKTHRFIAEKTIEIFKTLGLK